MNARDKQEARDIQTLVNNMTEKEVRDRLTAILFGHRKAYVSKVTARNLIGGSISYLKQLMGSAMIKIDGEQGRNNISAVDCLLNASIR